MWESHNSHVNTVLKSHLLSVVFSALSALKTLCDFALHINWHWHIPLFRVAYCSAHTSLHCSKVVYAYNMAALSTAGRINDVTVTHVFPSAIFFLRHGVADCQAVMQSLRLHGPARFICRDVIFVFIKRSFFFAGGSTQLQRYGAEWSSRQLQADRRENVESGPRSASLGENNNADSGRSGCVTFWVSLLAAAAK